MIPLIPSEAAALEAKRRLNQAKTEWADKIKETRSTSKSKQARKEASQTLSLIGRHEWQTGAKPDKSLNHKKRRPKKRKTTPAKPEAMRATSSGVKRRISVTAA